MTEEKKQRKPRKKMVRINMAFDTEEYDYIQTMARVSGITMTELVNKAIRDHKERHIELYEKAISFREEL